MSDPQIEIRHLVAGVIEQSEDTWQAALKINAMIEHYLVAGARHSGEAGCAYCSELVLKVLAARDARADEALDSAMNELVSHMSLESDLADDLGWLRRAQ